MDITELVLIHFKMNKKTDQKAGSYPILPGLLVPPLLAQTSKQYL